jgi:hypothetical protein
MHEWLQMTCGHPPALDRMQGMSPHAVPPNNEIQLLIPRVALAALTGQMDGWKEGTDPQIK